MCRVNIRAGLVQNLTAIRTAVFELQEPSQHIILEDLSYSKFKNSFEILEWSLDFRLCNEISRCYILNNIAIWKCLWETFDSNDAYVIVELTKSLQSPHFMVNIFSTFYVLLLVWGLFNGRTSWESGKSINCLSRWQKNSIQNSKIKYLPHDFMTRVNPIS